MNKNSDHDRDPDNDNNAGAVAPAPAESALTALATLGAALGNVDTGSVIGRTGLPMMTFKRNGDGTWSYGQKQTVVEGGSSWAINPTSFKWGAICFSNDNKVVAERLVPVSQPRPDTAALPDKGFAWVEQWAVNMKCLSGADVGVEATYKPTTVGGIQAIAGLIEATRDRLNGGQHGGKVSPIVHLEKDSYQHSQFGRVWTPMLTIVDWMPLAGPPPASAPASPSPSPSPASSSAEQPRRRRVGA